MVPGGNNEVVEINGKIYTEDDIDPDAANFFDFFARILAFAGCCVVAAFVILVILVIKFVVSLLAG
jgi:hypothetical protein